ncbi:MAG: hypothetical protein ACREN8_11075 [Candidatus Dormibacteraceae bacterium]
MADALQADAHFRRRARSADAVEQRVRHHAHLLNHVAGLLDFGENVLRMVSVKLTEKR